MVNSKLVFTKDQLDDQDSMFNRLPSLIRTQLLKVFHEYSAPDTIIFKMSETTNKHGFPNLQLTIVDVQGNHEWFRRYVLFNLASRSL